MQLSQTEQQTLLEAMMRPWFPTVTPAEEGYRLTIAGVDDFQVFAGSDRELLSEWRDLLESHLMGYVRTGKAIPMPSLWFSVANPEQLQPAMTGQWVLFNAMLVPAPEPEEATRTASVAVAA